MNLELLDFLLSRVEVVFKDEKKKHPNVRSGELLKVEMKLLTCSPLGEKPKLNYIE